MCPLENDENRALIGRLSNSHAGAKKLLNKINFGTTARNGGALFIVLIG